MWLEPSQFGCERACAEGLSEMVSRKLIYFYHLRLSIIILTPIAPSATNVITAPESAPGNLRLLKVVGQ
ncbi:MAG TPA: hypothetical protein DEF45_04215 [Rhodopirellula sp.]|nr:hypothetical protein [Rhodopirellula sp.]